VWLFVDLQTGNKLRLLAKCVQPISTLAREKIRCRGLNQTKTKCNTKVKVECVMKNEQIGGLATNHSLDPLPEQE